MNRYLVAAAVALSLGFVSAGKADAQIVYGYNVSPAPGGVVTNRTFAGPYGGTNYSTFFSPYGVRQSQMSSYNAFGGVTNRGYGYNPWTGMGYNYGNYAVPNLFSPWGGYNYGMYSYGRRW